MLDIYFIGMPTALGITFCGSFTRMLLSVFYIIIDHSNMIFKRTDNNKTHAKVRPRMHKLLILEYDHNQKIWYQNLAKKAFLAL